MDSLTELQIWLKSFAQNGLFLKTSQAYLIVGTDKISNMSSKHWMTSGISWRGEYWTQSSLEHPSAVVESSLSQVIKATAPQESFLKTDHLTKWLERSKHRSTQLPSSLEAAFKSQISLLSSTPPSDESQKLDLKQKATEMMEKPTPSTHAEAPTLYVRRMMASEYEELQGFPPDWTLVD